MKNIKIVPSKNKIIFAAFIIILGIIFRTVWHLGPNIEFVTAATLLAASYLGRKWAIIVPLSIMIITDFLIGNTNIYIFTWSAYAAIGIGAYYNLKFKILNLKYKIITAAVMGILASLWFYLWTNFGVWLTDSWGMYPKTLTGLFDAYILGLPFLRLNLISTLVFVPLSFTIVEVGRSAKPLRCFVFTKFKRISRYGCN
ncbi:hypothetical protein FJY90_06990 [Candidatus Gottesmanbacteria bacterium]|nr:hypothetical protein [Candidatus Gottesmanbacteria bacterium]MBM3713120.1 hypothetical protein [Actinomycetota bacterium]